MDDRKEQENGVQPESDGVQPENDAVQPENDAVQPEQENSEQTLHDELETLAKVFQEELDRAKAEAKDVAENGVPDPEILIQDLEEIPDDAHADGVTEEVIPQDELCERCKEKQRGTKQHPDSPYCEECDEHLRRYPFEWLHVVLVLLILGFVCYGGYVFSGHTDAFVAAAKADRYARQNLPESALENYLNAENAMQSAGVNGEMVYSRALLTLYRYGYINALDEYAHQIKNWELNLPHFHKVKQALASADAMMATANAASELVLTYETTPAADIPYDEVLAKLEALKTTQIPAEELTEAQSEETTGETTEAATANAQNPMTYDAPMVAFYQYYLALLCEKDMETQIGFLEQIRSAAPERIWLYGAPLGELYAKTKRNIEPLCTQLAEANAQDDTPVLLHAIAKRIEGDYDGAITLCQERIDAQSNMTYELYRQQSLCYLLKGDSAKGYEAANNAYQSTGPSIQLCNTLALAASAAGENEAYDEVKSLLEGSGYTVSKEVTEYRDGTRTIESILSEGDYDLT